MYSYCTVAFDSLRIHCCSITYNRTLKGEKNLAKGLPDVKTELDDIKDYPYCYCVSVEKSLTDFSSIETFYHSTYDSSTIQEVTEKIRNFYINHFSFELTFAKVIESFDK